MSSIIGIFLTLGVIAVGVSVIPTTSGGSTITWFLSTIIVLSILYSISFNVLTFNMTVGIGLVTKLTNMPQFSSDLNNIGFMPYLFFQVIGLIGLIGGIFAMKGSSG